MTNERLRAAIHQAGLEVDDLADRVEVDVKTVRRWLAGRPPRGRYRTRVAQALNTTEQDLWPEHDLKVAGRNERGEILAAYARASDLETPNWRSLLEHARDQVDLLDLTLTEILTHPAAPQLIADKSTAGCEIRLLLSAPDSGHLTLADAEDGHDLSVSDIPPSARQAEHSLAIAEQLADTKELEVRTFVAARSHTILRFDDEMLVTLPLYGTRAQAAPLLHLKRHSDHGLFEQFASHYEALWQDAQPFRQG